MCSEGGGTTYRKGGHIMTDTNGPGGPTVMAQLVRGDHLCRGTIYLVTAPAAIDQQRQLDKHRQAID